MAAIAFSPSLDGVAFAVGLLVVALGVVISWRAFQGYRRNESRPMLLLAVGMVLVTVVPTLTELVVLPFVARVTPPGTGTVSLALTLSRTCEAVGIGVLIYSISRR